MSRSGGNPERWARIDELYHAALERPEAERDSFLRQACSGDEQLLQEVFSLLRFDANEDFLQRNPVEIAMGLQPGQVISHYRIIEKIGEGGMGVVYKAEDTNLERTVALKFLAPHAIEGSESKTRFFREAKAAAALDHPNVCTVFEIGEAEGRVFLAMAFVEGDRVADRIARGPLKLGEALDIAIQTTQGLQAAHEKGIVHRDIKSANLMINRQGQVKIMDFGIAQLADHSPLTRTMTIIGTPDYLSPERAQRLGTDRRSDIWSVGILLYEMVTGRLPFSGDHSQAVLHSIINDEHEPITALRVGIPTELDRMVSKALAKTPDERYQYAEELLVDLRNLAKRPTANLTATSSQRPYASRERKLKLALGTLGVLLALSLVALAVILVREPPAVADEPTHRFSVAFEQARPVVSPNGRHIAYRSRDRLWIRDLNSETPREIPGAKLPLPAAEDGAAAEALGGYYTPEGYYLSWSPDSQSLVFPAGNELRRVSILEGGSATTICALPPVARRGQRAVGGIGWTKDGETIVFSTYGKGIYEVPARGGPPKLMWEEEHVDDLFLVDTPNGRAVVFASIGSEDGFGVHTLVVRAPDGDRRKLLTLDSSWPELVYSPTGHILFRKNPANIPSIWALPFSTETLQPQGEPFPVERSGQGFSLSDNGMFVYLDAGAGSHSLAWRDRKGNVLSRAAESHQVIETVSLSPDGKRAIATVEDYGQTAFWIYDVERFVKTRFLMGSEADGKIALGAFWLRTGKEIYYALLQPATTRTEVYFKSPDAGGPGRRFPLPEGFNVVLDGTTDNRYFTWTHTLPKQAENIWLWRTDASSGKGEGIDFSQNPKTSESSPVISPNERFIAYTSQIGGRREIFVRPFPEGPGRWQISTRGGAAPVWGPDGAELFFSESGKLMRAPVSTSAAFTAGTAEPLFEHPLLVIGGAPVARYAISSDGNKFLMVEPERELTRPVMRIAQNWLSELRRAAR